MGWSDFFSLVAIGVTVVGWTVNYNHTKALIRGERRRSRLDDLEGLIFSLVGEFSEHLSTPPGDSGELGRLLSLHDKTNRIRSLILDLFDRRPSAEVLEPLDAIWEMATGYPATDCNRPTVSQPDDRILTEFRDAANILVDELRNKLN
jgi:hypothetical protein